MFFSVLFSIISFVLVLFVLVIAHEWGHFAMARKFGVRVYEFGFGFPPKIGKIFHKNGTDFTANWIPLGGFVRLKGEDGSDASDPDSFASKSAWKRLVILLAGVVMNFIVGYLIFFGLFLYGMDMPITNMDVVGASVSHARVVVGGVFAGGPAFQAGMRAGDEMVRIGDVSIDFAQKVSPIIKNGKVGNEISVVVLREGKEISLTALLAEISPGVVGIGIQVFDAAFVRYGFIGAAEKAGIETKEISLMIFKTLGTIMQTLFTKGELQEGVSGPVGIAAITGKVARAGWVPLLQLMAMLSINLGVLNVLPIPSLDGGRALFVILGKVVRGKMRGEIERWTHVIGFGLLMLLVIAVTYRDISALLR